MQDERIGRRFGKLTIITEVPREHGQRYRRYAVRCDCGNYHEVGWQHLSQGNTQSCGCGRATHGHVVGGVMTPTYGSWRAMVGRCTRPTDSAWKYYGERGITICNRWREFANFLEDMGERPEGRTLDRIDVDGNYELGNCRWATPLEQTINRRTAR